LGGPLDLVEDGDQIQIDLPAGRINVLIDDEALAARAAAWVAPVSQHLRGWPVLYQAHMTQAPQGCDFHFLQAPAEAHLAFVEPVVGRS